MRSFSLWESYADQFPVRKNLIYLNHAAVAPLCRRSAEAMKHLADEAAEFGSFHYDRWLACYEGLRRSAAQLIGASSSEIAIVKNTSEGIATLAGGLQWRSGDKIVAFQEEFPANYYPWKRLERLGVKVEWLSVFDPLERIEQACRGARLLAISFVQYLSGYRADLHAIGEICARHDCLFFVDAIQGLGAFPLHVRTANIAALAADGHKWLLGPEGCGILYIRQDLQDQVEPAEFGWTNTAHYNDYASRDMTLRPDGGRYECGTLNTIGCFGLRASLEFLLEIGIENVAAAITERADQTERILQDLGCELLLKRAPATASGIVSFRQPNVNCHMTMRSLKENGILAATRQGWVRISPHFYNSPEEIARVGEVLSHVSVAVKS